MYINYIIYNIMHYIYLVLKCDIKTGCILYIVFLNKIYDNLLQTNLMNYFNDETFSVKSVWIYLLNNFVIK